MVESRAQRGLPVPSIWQVVVIGAALIAAWLVYSKISRHSFDPEEIVAANPLDSLHSLEVYLRQEAEPVPRLLIALDSQDPKERKLAAYGLGKIGPAADQALGKLRERLADDNALVREAVAIAIVGINADKESAAAAIAPLLADSDQTVRDSVRVALSDIGTSAVKPVREMLHCDLPATRLEVVRVLQYMYSHSRRNDWQLAQLELMDVIAKPLLELLKSDQPAIRLEAARLLQVVPYGAKWESLRADLGDVFNDPDPNVRIEAVVAAALWNMASLEQLRELLQDPARANTGLRAIAKLGEDAVPLLPEVLAVLDSQPGSLVSVLGALEAMKTGARPATERLVQIADTHRDTVCMMIASTLHAIGAEDDVVAGVLMPLLLDPDPQHHYSWRAGELMVKICPEGARRQVPLLVPKLGTNETSVDKTVLFALYSIGSQAQEAVPAVVPLLQNRDPWVVEFAGHMLGSTGIGAANVAANLMQVVGNGTMPVNQRCACANALGNIGPAAQSVVPALLKSVAEPEPDAPPPGTPGYYGQPSLRAAILAALGRIGGEDENLIPVLRSQLTSRSQECRAAAADALGRVAGQSGEVFVDLLRRIRDDDAGVRAMSALAIGRMTQGRTPAELETAVVTLMTALADEYSYVRRAAAISLGKIGPAARAALPALRQSLTNQTSSGSDGRSQRPSSLNGYWGIGELDHISVEKAARTAIEEIERGPQGD